MLLVFCSFPRLETCSSQDSTFLQSLQQTSITSEVLGWSLLDHPNLNVSSRGSRIEYSDSLSEQGDMIDCFSAIQTDLKSYWEAESCFM